MTSENIQVKAIQITKIILLTSDKLSLFVWASAVDPY